LISSFFKVSNISKQHWSLGPRKA